MITCSASWNCSARVRIHSSPRSAPQDHRGRACAQLRAAARRCCWDVGSIEPLCQLSDEKVAALCGGLEHDLLLRHRDAALIASGWFLARQPVALTEMYLDEMQRLGDAGFRLLVRHDKTAPNGYWITWPHTRAHGLVRPACRLKELLDVLEARGISRGPIFSPMRGDHRNGKPMSCADISVAVQALRRWSDFVDMGISGRSLRRGMATELSHRGVSEAERMEVLGHADRRTAARYVDQRVLG